MNKAQLELLKTQAHVDTEETLERLGDDLELFSHLLGWFSDDLDNTLKMINSAYACGNVLKTQEAFHKLKGSAANVGARILHQCALDAERICKQGHMEGVNTHIAEITRAASEFQTTIKLIRG